MVLAEKIDTWANGIERTYIWVDNFIQRNQKHTREMFLYMIYIYVLEERYTLLVVSGLLFE